MQHNSRIFALARIFALTSLVSALACSSEEVSMRGASVPVKSGHADAVENNVGDTVTPAPAPAPAPTPVTPDVGDAPKPDTGAVPPEPERTAVGMRNFRQLNDTMAYLTGVPRTTTAIATLFTVLETQLPDSNDLRTFNGSHQVAISKLAVAYCDAMIENTALATAAIPNFNFAALPSVAFDAAGKANVAKSLIRKFWGSGLETMPDEAETIDTMSDLIDEMVPGKANTAQFTKNIVKGVCVSLLASGQILMY